MMPFNVGSGGDEGNKFEIYDYYMANQGIGVSIKSAKYDTSPKPTGSKIFPQMGATVQNIMDFVPRPELDAKLEVLAARMDGRVAELTGKIDGYMARMEERDKRNDERAVNFASSLGDVKTELHETRNEIKSALGSMKSTVITTGIGSVLAIVLGVAAFNATVLSNMIASFESGKSTSAAIFEANKDIVAAVGAATKRLEQLQDRIDAQQKQAAAPPK